jgi:hypothetical protein
MTSHGLNPPQNAPSQSPTQKETCRFSKAEYAIGGVI